MSLEHSLNAKWIAHLHAFLVIGTFGTVLCLGRIYHWAQITSNADFKYPIEWFPSISAAIGDHIPERIIFQFGMALSATPRMLLSGLLCYYYLGEMRFRVDPTILTKPVSNYLLTLTSCDSIDRKVFVTRCLPLLAFSRTISAGLWIFITSRDHMTVHLTGMALYIVLSAIFYVVILLVHRWWTKSTDDIAIRSCYWKRFLSCIFPIQVVCAILFFYRHKVLKIPGGRYFFFLSSVLFFSVPFFVLSKFFRSHLHQQDSFSSIVSLMDDRSKNGEGKRGKRIL